MVGKAGEIIGLHAKALNAENLRHLPGQHWALVLGDADRTIKWRGAVAIEPHEWIHAVGVEGDEPAPAPEHPFDLAGQPPGVGNMMHQPGEQHPVQAFARKRQIFRIAFDQLQPRIFAPPERHQFGTYVEPDALVAPAPQQFREHAGAAAEVGDMGAARQAGEPHESRDQLFVRLRRKHIVFVAFGMGVEEGDLLALVLRAVRAHRPITYNSRGAGSGAINWPRKPLALSLGTSSSAMCQENTMAQSGWSSNSLASSTTGICVPGMHLPILSEPGISQT